MGKLSIISVEKNSTKADSLRINRAVGKVKGFMGVLKFIDKDTKQFIAFCPCFDITGYGETEEKAFEMLKFSVSAYFDHLVNNLSLKEMEAELSSLGWKHKKFLNKEYSNTYVDIDGQMKNFNAVDDKVERMTLQAA